MIVTQKKSLMQVSFDLRIGIAISTGGVGWEMSYQLPWFVLSFADDGVSQWEGSLVQTLGGVY